MKTLHACTLGVFIVGLLACSEPETIEAAPSVSATFDLSGSQLGKTDASSLIKSIGQIAEASTEAIIVRFERGDRTLDFEIALTEPEESYQLKPFVRRADGEWIHPKPSASPPGNIEPIWIRLTDRGVVRPGINSNAEFTEWLDQYVGAISSVGERSAIVVSAEAGVTCDQLFDILDLQSRKGLDRFLIERQPEPRQATEADPRPAFGNDDPDLD